MSYLTGKIENEISEGTSLLHLLDPRVKIIIFFVYSLFLIFDKGWLSLIFAGIYICFLLFFVKKQVLLVFRSVALANAFLIFVVISMPFTYSSSDKIKLGIFSLSVEGIKFGIYLFLKSNEILLLMVLLISTSSVFAIAHALHHMFVPSSLVQMLFFTYRYIHVIAEEYSRMVKAAKARGFKPRTDLFTYKTYAYIIANIFVRSYIRSKRIYKAMKCRGFDGTFRILEHFHFKFRDFVFLSLSIIYVFVCYFFIVWSGYGVKC